jgi:hypothetical protein
MRRRMSWAALTIAVVTVGLITVPATPAHAAAVADPERHSVTPTGWGYRFTSTRTSINDWAEPRNMRIIDVEVVTPTTFTVVMVRNQGEFQRGVTTIGSWVVDETLNSLMTKLEGKRLLDIESYTVDGQTRYAAALVDNGPAVFHNYKFYLDSTESYINKKVVEFGGRVSDIDPTGNGRYNAIVMPNKGVDELQTWWYPAKTSDEISKLLAFHKARLVDIEPDGAGKFAVVMVASKGQYWWWHPAATASQVAEIQEQTGMRLIHLKRYEESPGVVRYAVVYLDTMDAVSVKVRQAMWPAAGNAMFGFYLKRVDGQVYNGLQDDKQFEPASMLKALHHVTAMSSVHNGQDELSDPAVYYQNPSDPMNKDVCAYDDTGAPILTSPVSTSLEDVLKGMMEKSDNRRTDTIYDMFGPANINAMAASLGMTGTVLNHRIGCTWDAPGQIAAPNQLTLQDYGKLFEAVYRANNPILGTGGDRTAFTNLMADGIGTFEQMVKEEGAALGLPAAVVNTFYVNMKGAYKPGGYANGAPGACDANGCTALLMRSTGGGYVALPAKQNGNTVYREFVYGAFYDGVFDCGPGNDTDCVAERDALGVGRGAAYREMLRPHVKAALQTW